MILIGMKGRLRSGKDSAFEILNESLVSTVTRASFADKMKLSGVRALGFKPDPESVNDAVNLANQIKEEGYITTRTGEGISHTITGRQFWQFYGTEAHREVFGDNFWVDALLPRPSEHPVRDVRQTDNAVALRDAYPDTDILIVTDVRFPSEAKRVLALGGEVWQIDAEKRLGPLTTNAHVSEQPLPPELVTRTIDNNESLNSFVYNVTSAYLFYKEQR